MTNLPAAHDHVNRATPQQLGGTPISETASEKRRGRPPAFDPEYMASLAQTYLEIRTRRGLMNVAYMVRALQVLHHALEEHGDGARWVVEVLCDPERMKAGCASGFQPTILAELGRCEDPDVLFLLAAVAVRLLQDRSPVKHVVGIVRAQRLRGHQAGEILRDLGLGRAGED